MSLFDKELLGKDYDKFLFGKVMILRTWRYIYIRVSLVVVFMVNTNRFKEDSNMYAKPSRKYVVTEGPFIKGSKIEYVMSKSTL